MTVVHTGNDFKCHVAEGVASKLLRVESENKDRENEERGYRTVGSR